MLAMAVIVALIAVSVIYVTTTQAKETFTVFFDKQLAKEINRFQEQQLARAKPKMDAVESATSSVRVMAAIGAEDYSSFYSDLTFELIGIIEEGAEAGKKRFLRFVDWEGKAIHPDQLDHPNLLPTDHKELNKAIESVAEATVTLGEAEESITANLPLLIDQERVLYTVVLTPMFDREGYFAGTILFGLPLGDATVEDPSIRSALIINRSLYYSSVPEQYEDAVLEDFSHHQTAGAKDENIKLGGVRYKSSYQSLPEFEGFPQAVLATFYSQEAYFKFISDIQNAVITSSIFVLLLGVGISWLISHGMTVPIISLVAGTRKIAAGDYDVEVPVKSHDEIGLLTNSFNAMGKDLALKEKYRDVLERVSDKDVAEDLLSGSLELGGEVRDMAVLFCDIRGFTSLTEGMAPSEVIVMLNEHMTALSNVAAEYKGVIDKFVGDEIMVLFGAPKSYGNDSLNAVRCALAMIEMREKLNKSGKYNISIGIGVASGEMVAGRMGSESRLNYTVLGENVNLSARLCSKAGKMEVLVCDTSYARLNGELKGEVVEGLELKGFNFGKKAYCLRHNSIDYEKLT